MIKIKDNLYIDADENCYIVKKYNMDDPISVVLKGENENERI